MRRHLVDRHHIVTYWVRHPWDVHRSLPSYSDRPVSSNIVAGISYLERINDSPAVFVPSTIRIIELNETRAIVTDDDETLFVYWTNWRRTIMRLKYQ